MIDIVMIPYCGYEVRKISSALFEGEVVVGSSLDNFLEDNGNPEDLFSNNVHLLKSSGSARNALVQFKVAEPEESLKEIFVKEFPFKNTLHSLKHLLHRHRAQMIWRVSWYLLKHGVAVPEPIGYLLRLRGPFCVKGYFFSEVLLGCISLGKLAMNPEHLRRKLDSEELIATLAKDIACFHNCGVIHGDLKWTNILLHARRNRIWFVDLDSARVCGSPAGPAHVARDLARFVLNGLEMGVDDSIIDKFLYDYADNRNLARESIDKPMRRVLTKMQKRHDRKKE